jgi:2-polyprenyl-6-methoxyphenol hydroxylase-like FAD-dependent oxidoreductase
VIGKRIAIVGAGPAGLTAAIAAARLGLRATVYESSEDFMHIGGGIALQSNGLRVLERLGLLASFRPAIFPCRKIVLELPGGHAVVNNLEELPLAHNYLAVVLRYRLQEHLLAAANSVAPIRFGHRCTGARVEAGQVRLQFANGMNDECDIVIGADGAHSQVRTSTGLHSVRKVAGEAYLRGVSDVNMDEPLVREIWGAEGRRFGMAPLAAGRAYFYCSAPRGIWGDVRGRRLEAWIESWNSYGPRVREMLRQVPDWTAVNYDEPGRLRLARWCMAPVFLIGDAAHEMTPDYGQGVNAAMVDAVVLMSLLARCLQNGTPLAQAAGEYESIRRPFVHRTQSAAWRVGAAARLRSAFARSLRDAIIRSVSRLRPLKRRDLLLMAGYNAREVQYF